MDALFWFFMAIIMAWLEFTTVALVSVWFVVGASAALISALLGTPFWLQAVIFIAVSVVLLLALRPIVRKMVKVTPLKTNVDALEGKSAVVIEPIDNLQATGRVQLNGTDWTARSANGASIAAGTVVTVQRVEGVKLLVVPEKVPAAVTK